MTITIQGPSGSTFEFPDDIDPGIIDATMRKATGIAPKGQGDITAGGVAKALGSGAVSGVEGLAAIPQAATSGIDWLARKIARVVEPGITDEELNRRKAAAGKTAIGAATQFPEQAAGALAYGVKHDVDALTGGVANYQPQNKAEEYAKTGGEFLPNLIGGPAGIARRAVTNVVAPAVGAQVAGDVGKSLGVNEDVARFGGALAAIVLGHGATGVIMPKTDAGMVEAGARQGVQIPTAVAAEGMWPQRTGQFVSNIPIIGDPMIKGNQRMIEQMGGALDKEAQAAGAASQFGAGTTASTGIKNWITGESAKEVGDAYDNLRNILNPNTTTPLRNTLTNVGDIAGTRQGIKAPDPLGPAVKQVLEAARDPTGLTFEEIKNLRTRIGEQLDQGILPPDTIRGELSHIYSGLTSDLEAAAQNAGGNAGSAAFKFANNKQREIAGRREVLTKIIGPEGDASAESVLGKIESMAASGSQGDAARLAEARRSVPATDWQEIAGTVVSRLGRDPAGEFSPQRFYTAYGKMSDQGRNILFGGAGTNTLRQSLDDIHTISTGIQKQRQYGNPSGTAQTQTGIALAAGMLVDPVKVIGGAITGRVVAHALGRPATAASTAKWASAYGRFLQSPGPPTLVALGQASKNLAATYNDQLGTNIDPNTIMNAATSVTAPIQ